VVPALGKGETTGVFGKFWCDIVYAQLFL